jgi:VanZ family protein
VNKRYFAWSAVAIYCTLIFIGSSIPGDRIGLETPGIDKLLHTIEYLVLSILLYSALKLQISLGERAVFWFTVAGSSLYGLSDEVHQIFVPLREFDPADIACDASGAILGSYLMFRIANNVWRHH